MKLEHAQRIPALEEQKKEHANWIGMSSEQEFSKFLNSISVAIHRPGGE